VFSGPSRTTAGPIPDLDELRRLAPLLANAEVDELACEVIQQAVKHRTEVRARAAAV